MAAKPQNKNGRNSSTARGGGARGNSKNPSEGQAVSFRSEVILLAVLAACILLFISNFGIGGFIGEKISMVNFGLFGLMAYLVPVGIFIGTAFVISNQNNGIAVIKLVAGILFVSFLCLFVELVISGGGGFSVKKSFLYAAGHKSGGGALGGLLASALCPAIGKVGTYVVDVITLIISMVLLTERSFFGEVKKGGRKVYHTAVKDAARRREARELQREELALRREEIAQQREQLAQRRIDKKVEGVALNTKISPSSSKHSDNLSELKIPIEAEELDEKKPAARNSKIFERKKREKTEISGEPVVVEKVHRKPKSNGTSPQSAESQEMALESEVPYYEEQEIFVPKQEEPALLERELQEISDNLGEAVLEFSTMQGKEEAFDIAATQEQISVEDQVLAEQQIAVEDQIPVKDQVVVEHQAPAEGEHSMGGQYVKPPIALLTKGNAAQKDNRQQLQETALQLQQILKNFGVNVIVTDVSCGPSVTRYELQPELGVKVSKIVNLSDDIKLNLAAADIRIEAPIPGKAAVGIEVPNKKTVMVRFRELIEAQEFQDHGSSICFTAGKDIGGQVIVADIAKMPHLLIAGATGSGKSVCINTIIMSILYKANPEDGKLILIDPKVVELSVYNGIPHLFIPVVTDPKKAAGALHWAVAEMTDRYQKFADYQVRDLKGYNQKVEAIKDVEDDSKPTKLPQIVIVVDELADLMMVAPGDVEDAICRLAQLARAAGIHLIIATQRPSVDVITGLIKANMPSRIAFSVSSGVDSRTILDMNGAEKLLGNGDMLFYPQGYQKPLRVQGPFVSDSEVEAVVDFLKKQSTVIYNEEIEEKMNTVSISSGGSGALGGNERDAYFVEAGKFVIEKQKGSIGMLQRMFKIGFNRAARIMDQLEEAGVVGPEEGTKARKILMSQEQFQEYVDEYV